MIVGVRDENRLLQIPGALGWTLTLDEIATLDAVSRETPVYACWHRMESDRNARPKRG